MKVIVMPDLDRWRASSSTVANYVWAVLKVRALRRELNQALLEVERHKTALMHTRQVDALWGEAQVLLNQLDAETDGNDAHGGS